MKIKNLIALGMAFSLALIPVGSSFASEATENYMKDMQKVYEWKGMESEGSAKITLNTNKIPNQEDLNLFLELGSKSKATVTPLRTENDLNITIGGKGQAIQMIGGEVKVPNIKIFTDEDMNIYVDKASYNALAGKLGLGAKIEEDYAKLVYPKEVPQTLGVSSLSKIDSQKMMQAALTLMNRIDLGSVDLGLVENNGVYTANWDGAKMLDILDAFIKYSLRDYDAYLEFYNMLGIDLIAYVNTQNKALGIEEEMTKEDFLKTMEKAYIAYRDFSNRYLPYIKDVAKNSNLTYKVDFSNKDQMIEDLNLKLVIDLNALKQIKFVADNAKDLGGSVVIDIKTVATTKNAPELEIVLPASTKDIELDKLMTPAAPAPVEKTTEAPEAEQPTAEKKATEKKATEKKAEETAPKAPALAEKPAA